MGKLNAILCYNCGDTVSDTPDSMQFCSCGNIALEFGDGSVKIYYTTDEWELL